MQDWAQSLKSNFGPVDYAFIVAGVVDGYAGLRDTNEEKMLYCFKTNTIGPLLIAKELVANGLLKRGSVLANMTSKVDISITKYCCGVDKHHLDPSGPISAYIAYLPLGRMEMHKALEARCRYPALKCMAQGSVCIWVFSHSITLIHQCSCSLLHFARHWALHLRRRTRMEIHSFGIPRILSSYTQAHVQMYYL